MADEPTATMAPGVSRTRELATAAAKLETLAREIGHDELAATVRADAKRRLEDGRVRVVVLGEIKHGKSSLINALLQAPLLPIGVTPTTGAVVAIRVDPETTHTGTFLVDHDGAREALEHERFVSLARGKELDPAGRTPELLVDAAQLPATLELIDTPGFNDIDRFRAALSRSELPRADVLVLVLDATQALSRSELGLIRDAIAAVGGLEDSGARCFLVINRIDLVPDGEEREGLIAHIREELATVIPGELTPYLTNAKAALREGFEASEATAAVGRLRDDLHGLASHGHEILPARARSALLRHARLLGYNAAIQSHALRLAATELDAERAAVEQAMATQARDLTELRAMIHEASGRILEASDERLDKFRAELEEAARGQIHRADIHTLSQVVPGAIQDAFLEFVQHERERLRAELEQLLRDLVATSSELARRRLDTATLPLGFRGPGLYVDPPKLFIEVGMVALGLAGTVIWYFGNTMTGMVMTIASPLTTVILREKTVRDAREQARAALPAALDGALSELRTIISTTVKRHGEALDDHLMLAERMLSEQLLEGLRRASERLSTHGSRIDRGATVDPTQPSASDPKPEAEAAAATKTEAAIQSDEAAEADAALQSAEAEADDATQSDDAAQSDDSAPTDPESETDPTEPQEPAVESALERTQRRISAAALAELDALEARLATLVLDLEALPKSSTDAEPSPPAVLH